MIVELNDTTVSQITKWLVQIREEGGAVALGRVLTLIIVTEAGSEEEVIRVANDVSREHPMRLIVLASSPDSDEEQLDAEIRVGGDAGASEVIVLRSRGSIVDSEESLVTGLLLPDTPVVAWWPGVAPEVPADTPLGRIAQRRIVDSASDPDPIAAVRRVAGFYRPGDSDLAWTRLTLWRAHLAAALDQPPFEPVQAIKVAGAVDSASTLLLAGWLGLRLQAPVEYRVGDRSPQGYGIHSVELLREHGTISLQRSAPGVACYAVPEQPDHDISLPKRSLRECLGEELRRLDPDEMFGAVVTDGLALLPAAEPAEDAAEAERAEDGADAERADGHSTAETAEDRADAERAS